MCATDIFMLEGVDHLVVGDFYLKMIFVQCIPPGQSNANKVSLLKEMFVEHGIPQVLRSDNGPQYVSTQFADFCICWGITHETSSLHYPQSIGFAEACIKSIKTHTPKSQVQWCWSTARLTSTLSYTHWHQASVSSRATVPVLTQNNHSGQDLQQWPIIHIHLWADWHMLWSCHITGWQMQQNTCATVCWSTSCNVWHPQKDLGSCYCYMCPTMEQLSGMHQQWVHIPLHAETPSWMQCQSNRHCPKWHNCHAAGSDSTLLLSSTTCTATTCTTYAAHTCCTWNTGNADEPGPSCSCHAICSKECPGTNVCDILCHTCASTKIQPCPHGT